MSADSTYLALSRLEYHYPVNTALSFKFGAIAATTVCALGYVLYTWLGVG